MKFENTEVFNFEGALRGMRNPKESWKKSDSYRLSESNPEYKARGGYFIGPNDMKLAQTLIKGGSEHRKFMRQIFVSVDITAPLYWWKEADTYKIGTTANSESTMHCILKQPFNMAQFELPEEEEQITDTFFDVKSDIPENEIVTKDIQGFEDYVISNQGEIFFKGKTCITANGRKRTYKSHIVKQAVNSSNYKKVSLRKDGVMYNKYVHRLIAENFIPNPHNLPMVNHKDGNKWNNNISNLEWVTASENAQHAHTQGLANITSYNRYRVGRTARRFDYVEVQEILEKFAEGYTKKEIATMFNCADSIIGDIINGKTYQAIEPNTMDLLQLIVDDLNNLREQWLVESDIQRKKYIWKAIIALLPESWLQKRTMTMNYENLYAIYHQRKDHKLNEWSGKDNPNNANFIAWLKTLPYSKEFIWGIDN